MQASVRLVVGCAMPVVGIVSAETRALDMRAPPLKEQFRSRMQGNSLGAVQSVCLGRLTYTPLTLMDRYSCRQTYVN
jgi:hypothetical protein